MEKFSLIPTLEHLTLSSLSRELWKQQDIVREVKDLFYSFPIDEIKWDEVRGKVHHKLTLLHLPHLLKDKTEDFIEQIGRQIGFWIENNKEFLPQVDMVNFLHLLQWNAIGGIDEKKTAELILETRDGLSLEQCYILACNNCLEDKIRLLWKCCPLHKRKSLFTNMSKDLLNGEINLVQYWSYCNEGTLESLDNLLIQYNGLRKHSKSLNEFFVYWSWRVNKNVVFQYFWKKLSVTRKLHIIYGIMSTTSVQNSLYGYRREILYFFATHMNEIQLKELVNINPLTILYFWFREGVRQQIYLTPHDSEWNPRFSKDSCVHLIDVTECTTFNVLSRCSGNRLQIVFRKFWKTISSHIKRSMFEKWYFIWKLLSCFMIISDTETLQLIYDDATAEEKARINHFLFHNFENSFLIAKEYRRTKTTASNKTAKLSEKEVGDFLKESLLSLSSEKMDDERWPFLETLDKWKEKHVIELILFYISIYRFMSNYPSLLSIQ